MASKANAGAEIISTPQGGGALRGIGETFSPDLYTGTGNFTVPLAFPAGRNGFGPQPSLAYSTGNGNGPFGMGWSLGVPGISRKTSQGIPKYMDGDEPASEGDTYLLSGAEDLVAVAAASATFDLEPGEHTVSFTAVRVLKARVYCTQRHLPGSVFEFDGVGLSSNRRFDLDGNETTGTGDNPQANALSEHLFGGGAIAPTDEWTVELRPSDNPYLQGVTSTDVVQYDLAGIGDAVVTLEYEAAT